MRCFHRLLCDSESPRGIQRVHEYVLPETTSAYWELNEARCYDGGLVEATRVVVTSGRPTDLLNNSMSWVCVSSRLLELVHRFEAELQVFDDLGVVDRKGASVAGYHVLNILRRVECLDMKRTDASWSNKKKRRARWVTTAVIEAAHVPPEAHGGALARPAIGLWPMEDRLQPIRPLVADRPVGSDLS